MGMLMQANIFFFFFFSYKNLLSFNSEQVYNAMKGLGTNDDKLVNIYGSRTRQKKKKFKKKKKFYKKKKTATWSYHLWICIVTRRYLGLEIIRLYFFLTYQNFFIKKTWSMEIHQDGIDNCYAHWRLHIQSIWQNYSESNFFFFFHLYL